MSREHSLSYSNVLISKLVYLHHHHDLVGQLGGDMTNWVETEDILRRFFFIFDIFWHYSTPKKCWSMSKNVEVCRKMSKMVEKCRKILTSVKKCRSVSKNVEDCQKMSKNVERCQKMSKIIENCRKLTKNVNIHSGGGVPLGAFG